MIFEFQSQPTDNSCMSTCVAMILGIPAVEAVELYHDKLHSALDSFWFDDIFDAAQIVYEYGHPKSQSMREHHAMLLTVPSLNCVGGTHQILVWHEDDLWWVADPQMNNEGCKYYVPFDPENEDQAKLISWTVDMYIPLGQPFFAEQANE